VQRREARADEKLATDVVVLIGHPTLPVLIPSV